MGNPSAGKSAMFSQMTGVNVIVSNIPQINGDGAEGAVAP